MHSIDSLGYGLFCSGDEYRRVRVEALVYAVLWLLGSTVLYMSLLRAVKPAVQRRRPTPLSRATSFLHSEVPQSTCQPEPRLTTIIPHRCTPAPLLSPNSARTEPAPHARLSQYDVKWAGSFETVEQVRKTVLLQGMMFVPQRHAFLRLTIGTVISVIAELLMCILRLYKTQENIIVGIMIQLTLVLFFIDGGWAVLYISFAKLAPRYITDIMTFHSAREMLQIGIIGVGTMWLLGISYVCVVAATHTPPRTIRLV